jgi:hypothetical protein
MGVFCEVGSWGRRGEVRGAGVREWEWARANGRMGEWANGRMGEWTSRRVGEWENGR